MLWLHIIAINAIKKGAAHRNICRNKEIITNKVQRTAISNAWFFKYKVHFPCILQKPITSYYVAYMIDMGFSADPM